MQVGLVNCVLDLSGILIHVQVFDVGKLKNPCMVSKNEM